MNFSMTATGADLAPRNSVPAPKPPVRPPIPLRKAQDYGNKIAEWIAPYCLQIELAGPLRRQCATCDAIELLVLPRFEANANLLFNFLDNYVQNERLGAAQWLHSTGRRDLRGLAPAHFESTATLLLPKCDLILHTAQPNNWFLRWFEATGSAAHLESIRQRVLSLPGSWEPGDHIRVRNKRIVPQSEGHIYDVLNMSLVPPWKRTA